MLEQAAKNAIDAVTRGEILLFLKGVYPQGATPLTLRHYLNGERAILLSDDELSFHVHYLQEAGFVSCETQRGGGLGPEKIRLVKIAKAGIDRVEGHAGSDGVML